MRVVVWNMAHKGDRAWAALERLEPDICLLNEAIVPRERQGVWSASGTHGRDRKKRLWTAAVITAHPSHEITDATPQWRGNRRDVPFQCSRPGVWIAARVDTQIGKLAVVALYGLLDEFSDASVHRSLSEVSPLLDDPRYNKLVILGGDLNTGTQWPKAEQASNERDRNVLERISALGLVDCIQAKRPKGRLEGCLCVFGEDCGHVRTRLDPRIPSVPYQTDYLFATRALASKLERCEVLASDEWFAISDHAPIVADFRLEVS